MDLEENAGDEQIGNLRKRPGGQSLVAGGGGHVIRHGSTSITRSSPRHHDGSSSRGHGHKKYDHHEYRQEDKYYRDTILGRKCSAMIARLLSSCYYESLVHIIYSKLFSSSRSSSGIRRIVLIVIGIIIYITIRKKLRGKRVDSFLKRRVMVKTLAQQKVKLDALGIKLPIIKKLDHALNVNSFAAMRELLIRREQRAQIVQELERSTSEMSNNDSHYTIPKVVFVPTTLSWIPPRPDTLHELISVPFDEIEMRQLIEEYWPTLLTIYDTVPSASQTGIWCLCTVYAYGGVFVGQRHYGTHQQVKHFLRSSNSLFTSVFVQPLAVTMVDPNENGTSTTPIFVAATPQHPLIRCILQIVEKEGMTVTEAIRILTIKSSGIMPVDVSSGSLAWHHFVVSDGDNLCSMLNIQVVDGNPMFRADQLFQVSLYLGLLSQTEHNKQRSSHQISVQIRELDQLPSPKIKKKSILSQLLEEHAVPGWICNRCLNYAELGSYEKCAKYCPHQFEQIICDSSEIVSRTTVSVDVHLGNMSPECRNRIPHIIHQTFFDDVTVDRYPTLYRLKNSWRKSGWDYRFYNDDQARKYISNNYPKRFLDAFDSLLYGAYKADLFRYLVLLKDGGVYADIDILLETNMDEFLTPTTSFFVARDVVGDYAGHPFCLWNGLLGSSPAHPFIVRAVERLTNLIEKRADLYDMEHDICRRNGKSTGSWTVREEPLLLLSGPCGLGVAVNEALNRSSTASFESGWLSLGSINYSGVTDFGDALILVGDKYDMGAFRISDPERDIVVASTDLPQVDKNPRNSSHPIKADLLRGSGIRKSHAHYSESNKGGLVWGSENVYVDQFVTNQQIQLHVQYEIG